MSLPGWAPEPWESMYGEGRRGGTAPRCDVCGRFAKRVHEVVLTSPYPEPSHVECDRCRNRRLRKLAQMRKAL